MWRVELDDEVVKILLALRSRLIYILAEDSRATLVGRQMRNYIKPPLKISCVKTPQNKKRPLNPPLACRIGGYWLLY